MPTWATAAKYILCALGLLFGIALILYFDCRWSGADPESCRAPIRNLLLVLSRVLPGGQ